jgi:hypothetical protein
MHDRFVLKPILASKWPLFVTASVRKTAVGKWRADHARLELNQNADQQAVRRSREPHAAQDSPRDDKRVPRKSSIRHPTIRLPFTFSGLLGLSTHIYQTVHDGALAFLVVVSSSVKSEEESQKKLENFTISATTVFTRRRS